MMELPGMPQGFHQMWIARLADADENRVILTWRGELNGEPQHFNMQMDRATWDAMGLPGNVAVAVTPLGLAE